MMKQSKQKTLFQTWGSSSSSTAKKSLTSFPQKNNNSTDSRFLQATTNAHGSSVVDTIDLCDDDDDDDKLLSAILDSESNRPSANHQQVVHARQTPSLKHRLNVGVNNSRDEEIQGFDLHAGELWIYPTNYPVRDYQFHIVKESLTKNTMVVLPTGLGKTFIAAVVMYNFYRWYPQGKVIFMAPTKPLVAQQIEACYNIMGIPQEDTAEMTGAMQPADRKKAWQYCRMFFLTPQVLTNDLSRGALPSQSVKCLVVDEAHKALGNHAYCQVVRELVQSNQQFRILALSATPGSDIKAVQQVLCNLLIAHIELRTEDSPDIRGYSHERKVDKIVVSLGQELSGIKEQYLKIVDVVVQRLRRQGVLYNRPVTSLSKFMILKAREAFRQNPPHNVTNAQCGAIEGDFALCMSLYHGYELLQQHGLRSLYNFLESLLSGEKGYARTRTELTRNPDFCRLMDFMCEKFKPIKCPNPSLTQSLTPVKKNEEPLAVGHPKMAKLLEIVLEHFKKFQEGTCVWTESREDKSGSLVKTRVMIFSSYRDSVNEITEMLSQHRPLVRVMSFIGQSSAGKATKGFTQKEQLKVMSKFREGGYNTLVSTCVGEEGLDIGDVDLIICFDAHKSPIRLVQRMGRTGRKREGRIVMLVTEGKEEQIYNQSQYSKRSIHKAIQQGSRSLQFYLSNPTMIPGGVEPQCHKMHITVSERFKQNASRANKANKTAEGTSKITAMISKQGRSGSSSKNGYLSASELQEWSDKYKVDDAVIPSLPTSTISCLKPKNERLSSVDADGSVLSLSEWSLWQDRLQPTRLMSHSKHSHHLVELMEFMSVQQAVPEDEDNYGLEMKLYLKDEDVLKRSRSSRRSILNFCTQGEATNATESSDKLAKPGTSGLAGRRAKSKRPELPALVSSPENSDDDLPALLPARVMPKTDIPDKTVTESDIVNKCQQKHKDTGVENETDVDKTVKSRNRAKKTSKKSSAPFKMKSPSLDQLDNCDDFKDFDVAMTTMYPGADNNDDHELMVVDEAEDIVTEAEHNNHQAASNDPAEVEEKKNKVSHVSEGIANFSHNQDLSYSHKPLNGDRGLDDAVLDELFPVFPSAVSPAGEGQANGPVKDLLSLIDEWTRPQRVTILKGEFEKMKINGEKEFGADWKKLCSMAEPDSLKQSSNGDTGAFGVEISTSDFPQSAICDIPATWSDEEFSVNECIEKDTDSKRTAMLDMKSDCLPKEVHRTENTDVILGEVHVKTPCRTGISSPKNTESNTSPSELHQSFYDDMFNDSAFDNFKTPAPVRKTLSSKKKGPDSSSKSSSNLNSSIGASQMTFSQAMSFISDTPDKEHNRKTYSSSDSESSGDKIDRSANIEEITALNHYPVNDPMVVNCNSERDTKKTDPENVSTESQLYQSHTENTESVLPFSNDQATFDLGFDFDSGDEIVPPSPPAATQSLTQSGLIGNSSNLSMTFNKTAFFKTSLPNLEEAKNAKDEPKVHKELAQSNYKHIAENRKPFQSIENNRSSNIQITEIVKEGSIEDGIKEELYGTFDFGDDLFDEVDFDDCETNTQRPDSKCSPEKKSDSLKSCETNWLCKSSKESKIVPGGKSEVSKFSSKSSKGSLMHHCDDEDFLDPFVPRKQHRRNNLSTNSRSSEGHSNKRPSPVYHIADDAFSEDGSPVCVPQKRRRALVLDSPATPELSLIKKPQKRNRNAVITSPNTPVIPEDKPSDHSWRTVNKSPVKKKKERRRRLQFIEEEAGVSGDEGSEDESEDSDYDQMDDSFLNDMTQLSQATKPSDMQAVYMQSVRSPLTRPPHGRYKLQYESARSNEEVFSQRDPLDEESRYIHDSFCVDEDDDDDDMDGFIDDEEIASGSSGLEDTIMVEAKRQMNPKKKKNQSKRARKRVVIQDSSSEDDATNKPSVTTLTHDDSVFSPPSKLPIRFTKRLPTDSSSSGTSVGCSPRKTIVPSTINGSPSYSQMPSLRTRCERRLDQYVSNKPDGVVNAKGVDEEAVFSLELSDFIDDNDPMDDFIKNAAMPSDESNVVSANTSKGATIICTVGPHTGSVPGVSVDNVTLLKEKNIMYPSTNNATHSVSTDSFTFNSTSNYNNTSSFMDSKNQASSNSNIMNASSSSSSNKTTNVSKLSRNQRLQLVKQKQEEFKKKYSSDANKSSLTSTSLSDQTLVSERKRTTNVDHDTSHLTAPARRAQKSSVPVIFVDSRQLSSAQALISALRHQYELRVETRQLDACDYILSNRLGLERMSYSDAVNGANKEKVVRRIKQMYHAFERSCLLVEHDRVKPGEKATQKPLLNTKYTAWLMASLSQTRVKIIFSQNQADSAKLISTLVKQEEKKGMTCNFDPNISSHQEQALKFYLALPTVTYVTALNFLYSYKSIHEFINSTAISIEKKGKITKSRAEEIYKLLRHSYDLHMTPIKR